MASSINMIGALDNVALAIGQKPEDVRRLQMDWNRRTAVADELRALLNGVEGSTLVRRQRLALVSAQAYSIGTQLARDPGHSVLVPHVQEVKRLKRFSNRKKTAANPQTSDPKTPDPTFRLGREMARLIEEDREGTRAAFDAVFLTTLRLARAHGPGSEAARRYRSTAASDGAGERVRRRQAPAEAFRPAARCLGGARCRGPHSPRPRRDPRQRTGRRSDPPLPRPGGGLRTRTDSDPHRSGSFVVDRQLRVRLQDGQHDFHDARRQAPRSEPAMRSSA